MFYNGSLSYLVIEVGFHYIFVFSSMFLCILLLYLGYISAFMSFSKQSGSRTVAGMWTTFDGGHSATSPMSV
jgi:hypothetical protein